MKPNRYEDIDRFIMPEPNTGCWLWIGPIDVHGYGRWAYRGVKVGAHRAVYGPVLDGYELDHLCRVRRCVNPKHLEVVTHTVNVMRGQMPAAINARKATCLRGHNNWRLFKGRRYCRPCQAERARAK